MSPALFTLIATLTLGPELARWRRLGRRPAIWWRDDDARAPSPALDRLLILADGRPLALAVIPDGDPGGLARRLARTPNVTVGQHGIDHVNRAPPSARGQWEYANEVGGAEIATAIGAARARLAGAGLEPAFYAPPWNAVRPGLAEALAAARFTLVSAGGRLHGGDALAYAPCEIDIMAWKRRPPAFRGARKVLSAVAKALRQRRRDAAFARPLGLLTHHLAHDEAAWRFVAWFLPFADQQFAWCAITGAAPSPPEEVSTAWPGADVSTVSR